METHRRFYGYNRYHFFGISLITDTLLFNILFVATGLSRLISIVESLAQTIIRKITLSNTIEIGQKCLYRCYLLPRKKLASSRSWKSRHFTMGKTPHVAIIGAGFSGLRCADILSQNDVQVTILEARDRVGGRVSIGSIQSWWDRYPSN